MRRRDSGGKFFRDVLMKKSLVVVRGWMFEIARYESVLPVALAARAAASAYPGKLVTATEIGVASPKVAKQRVERRKCRTYLEGR